MTPGGGPSAVPAPFRLSGAAPVVQPLDGRPLAVHLVVNLEHRDLAEPMPRAVLPAPHGRSLVPDVANFSWLLYGLRCGLPRLMRALEPAGAHVTVAANGAIVDEYPEVVDLVRKVGWEIIGHGWRQRSLQAEDDEAAVIAATLDALERATGTRSRGWLSPGMGQSWDTLTRLRSAGIEYCHDFMIDDRPLWLATGAGPLLGLTYSVELNDVPVYVVQGQPDGALYERVVSAVEVMAREAQANPLICSIGLHPHLMGVAHRAAELERIVGWLADRPDVVFATSGRLADWWTAQVPPPTAV
jgi:hypothetical protein